jgi:hypothetical protein
MHCSLDSLNEHSGPSKRAFAVQLRGIDLSAARTYLCGVTQLAREASQATDPRVLLCALEVLKRAPHQIERLEART